jgi:hypothetical protein
VQIASGVHRVGSEIVNSYPVVEQDGVTIIDAGQPGYWKLLADRGASRAPAAAGPGDY